MSPRTKIRRSSLLPDADASFAAKSGNPTSASCTKILPSAFTETVSGSLSWLNGAALAFGRSTVTPDVINGAATMNTINSTSITSTNGVTLISASGLYRPRPRPGPLRVDIAISRAPRTAATG